jgi:hypothetical protein
VVLVLLVVVIGLLLPQSYSVSKSINITARAASVKPLISDFSQWYKWSPWKKIDPTIEFQLGEPSAGVGAHQSWQSKWGTGEMTLSTLTDSTIVINILFADEHIITGDILFVEHANSVTVTFNVQGQATLPLLSGYIALLSEWLLKNALAQGLNNLKTVAQLNDAQTIMDNHQPQQAQ